MAGHDYKLKYNLTTEVGHFQPEELKAKGVGGTDGLIVISCIEAENGSYSQTHFSVDGNNNGKDMPSIKEFKAWSLMGAALLKRKDLDPVFQGEVISSVARKDAVNILLDAMEYHGILQRPDSITNNGITHAQAQDLLFKTEVIFDGLPMELREESARLLNHRFKYLTRDYSEGLGQNTISFTFSRHHQLVEKDRLEEVAFRLRSLQDSTRINLVAEYLGSLKPDDKFLIRWAGQGTKEVEFVKYNPEKSFQYNYTHNKTSYGRLSEVTDKVMVKWYDFVGRTRSFNCEVVLSPELESKVVGTFEKLVAASGIKMEDYHKVIDMGIFKEDNF